MVIWRNSRDVINSVPVCKRCFLPFLHSCKMNISLPCRKACAVLAPAAWMLPILRCRHQGCTVCCCCDQDIRHHGSIACPRKPAWQQETFRIMSLHTFSLRKKLECVKPPPPKTPSSPVSWLLPCFLKAAARQPPSLAPGDHRPLLRLSMESRVHSVKGISKQRSQRQHCPHMASTAPSTANQRRGTQHALKHAMHPCIHVPCMAMPPHLGPQSARRRACLLGPLAHLQVSDRTGRQSRWHTTCACTQPLHMDADSIRLSSSRRTFLRLRFRRRIRFFLHCRHRTEVGV